MRSFIIASIFLSQVAFVEASCRVFIPQREFSYSGYSIRFDFTKLLNDNNYLEVYSPEEADFELKLQGSEVEGRFHRAVAVLEMGPYKAEESVVCYTQNCAINDFGKAFRKAYKNLSEVIPACQ